ncbi:MAG: exo-beta-D-glucosaminidase [Nonomuraea sp.]|nr:exo-beta-D-glucosaminidase [Nonomuraea sp.]
MKRLIAALLLFFAATAVPAHQAAAAAGWALRSATGLSDTGAAISRTGYGTAGWYPVDVPSTVLAGLVKNGVYQDIYFGQNLKNVPDLTGQDWWYRGEFTAGSGPAFWLRFAGISYRAQVWVNGTLVDGNAVGSLVRHEYNVTSLVTPGQVNAVAVRVTPPAHDCKDLSICTVDWNPEAPDMNAGIWNAASLDSSPAVSVRDPYVRTTLSGTAADLQVYADAVNATNAPVTTTITGTITKAGQPTIDLSQSVTLAAGERKEVAFAPIHVANPVLWWPYQFGSPELYRLTLNGVAIDFGIRQVTDYRTTVNGTSFVGYKINGKPILLRGGGYVWDLLQRWDTKTNAAHVAYVKGMGLNTIRLEGTLGNRELYDLADREGVLVMPGFVCCSAWENDSSWTTEQTQVAQQSLDSQLRDLRHHASVFVWAYGSDQPPTAAHLAAYKSVATALHWQNPTLDNVASYSNADAGVKMDGPYVWEPPVLWWDTSRAGSAFGTTAEEGTESPPPLESLQRFLAPADVWPIGTAFNYHAGKPRSVFDTITPFTDGITKRYGTASSAADYSRKSELQNYENARAFFEAWSAKQHTQTFGAIFWMLNNAWPSVHWNLYDYYLKPGGGYFGTRKATEPVHVSYDYFTRKVYVVNSTLTDRPGLTATATLYNLPDLTVKSTTSAPVAATANTSVSPLTIPAVTGLSTTYLVRLQLKDSAGATVSGNVYWYSTSPDTLGNKSSWYRTTPKNYANLTGLNALPANNAVTATAGRTASGATITLTNTSATALAFFARPEVTAGDGGREVVPVTYSDNYVTLWPGESTTITAAYDPADLGGQQPYLRLRGYNLPTTSTPVS